MSSNASIYEVGLNELHRVSSDKGTHEQIDTEFKDARGREGARLHVTLRAVSESDKRQSENSQATWNAISRLTQELNERTSALTNLINSFEHGQDKRIAGVAEQARILQMTVQETRASVENAVQESRNTLQQSVNDTRNTIQQAVQETRSSISAQSDAHFQAVSSQARENTERIAVDLRHVRDEVVGLVDSRMTQSDASFAALRGDVEVVKFLVMDLIKDRIGRSDPKQKPF